MWGNPQHENEASRPDAEDLLQQTSVVIWRRAWQRNYR